METIGLVEYHAMHVNVSSLLYIITLTPITGKLIKLCNQW